MFAFHSGIKTTPYEAMFGSKPKVGLSSTSLPQEVIDRLETEEDLLALHTVTPESTPEPEPTQEPTPTPQLPSLDHMESSPEPQSSPDPQDPQSSPEPQPLVITVDVHQEQSPPSTPSRSPPVLLQHTSVPFQLHTDPPPLSPAPHITSRMEKIAACRKRASEAQHVQAERMVKRSRVDLQAGAIGDNVAVPIPLVDRGRGDPRNILGVIIDRNEHDMYTIAVSQGILKTKYTRIDFDLCPQKLLSIADVNTTDRVSLREALKKSASGGQGFTKCNCSASAKQCRTKRCKCVQAGVLCNSRCHNSSTCKNK